MVDYVAMRGGARFQPWSFGLALSALVMAVIVFMVTQSVKTREMRVSELNRQILAEQQTLRVLDAEWAYLNRPQRLEELMAMRAGHEAEVAANEAAAAGKIIAQKRAQEKAAREAAAKIKIHPPKVPDRTVLAAQKQSSKTKVAKAKPAKKARAKTPSAKGDDLIWSPKLNKAKPRLVYQQYAGKSAQAIQVKHGGVARPIVE